jgi:hypothetical protein
MKTDKAYKEVSATLSEAIENLRNGYKGNSLTDIYLIVDEDSGELSIFDDEENLLSQRIIESWISDDDNEDVVVRLLREVVEKFDMDNKFDDLDIYKPFSVNLADENFIVQEELLLIEDDSIIRIESDFMDRIDKEFDEFLDRLLNE